MLTAPVMTQLLMKAILLIAGLGGGRGFLEFFSTLLFLAGGNDFSAFGKDHTGNWYFLNFAKGRSLVKIKLRWIYASEVIISIPP